MPTDEIVDTSTQRFKDEAPEVSILMPVHNEAESIEAVVKEFYNELKRGVSVEVVCCEDGSTDGTKDVLRSLAKEVPMKAILGASRKGYSKAIVDGVNYASGRYILFTDSDGQCSPQDFWKLYEQRLHYDVVSGCRVNRADPLHRRVMSTVFQRMAKALFKLPKLRDITAPFRLVEADAAKRIACECKYMKESFWTEFTIRAHAKGYRITEVPVTHRSRAGGGTRVYKPTKIPKIAAAQLQALLELWQELK